MKEKRMKDYLNKPLKITATTSFVKIETKDESVIFARSQFLEMQQMILETWLLDD